MPISPYLKSLRAELGTRLLLLPGVTAVVFDGAGVMAAPPRGARGVRVLFSKAGVTADELIRQLVRAEPPGRPVIVVSTDREVADGIAKAGARPVASVVLLKRFSGG
jgi:predicted RNA-binding protein with PIN domain